MLGVEELQWVVMWWGGKDRPEPCFAVRQIELNKYQLFSYLLRDFGKVVFLILNKLYKILSQDILIVQSQYKR